MTTFDLKDIESVIDYYKQMEHKHEDDPEADCAACLIEEVQTAWRAHLHGHYSAAIDEIYRLREALAYEALVTEGHTEYKTFPKSRRKIAEEQVRRLRQAARGWAQSAYAGRYSAVLRRAMSDAGAKQTLTRYAWENERPGRPGESEGAPRLLEGESD